MTDAEKDMERRVANLIGGLRHSTKEGERDADALEALLATLRAEVERLTSELDGERQEIKTLRVWRDAAIARLVKLEAALWPFARIKMVPYSVMASDDASIELSGFELIDGKAFIKASAFRNARASLTEGE